MTGNFRSITVLTAFHLFLAFERVGAFAIVGTVSGADNGAITEWGVDASLPHTSGITHVSRTVLF